MFKFAAALVLALSAFSTPVERQGCADVTVIFARGTLEASPIGSIVGPPFRDALGTALSGQSLSFVGVDYPATIQGFEEGGDPNGARTMATDVTNTANSCPDTAIVMSGYSQGAQLVHLAARQLSSTVASRVNAVVMFGDPDNGQTLAGGLSGRSLTFCARGDDICAGGQIINSAHLSYGANAGEAASFVAQHV